MTAYRYPPCFAYKKIGPTAIVTLLVLFSTGYTVLRALLFHCDFEPARNFDYRLTRNIAERFGNAKDVSDRVG